MVGEMENYKIKVNNESESKEVQNLFFELGFGWCCGDIKKTRNTSASYIYCYKISKDMTFGNSDESFYNHKNKEITLQQLRDLVVLNRNDVFDANYESELDKRKYYLTSSEFFEFINGAWVNIDELVEGMSFKFINKESEVKMKEYLDTNYELRSVKQTSGDNRVHDSWIEVPEGADILYFGKQYKSANHFFKTVYGKSYYKYLEKDSEWMKYSDEGSYDFKDIIDNFLIMWQRNTNTTTDTSIKEKLKFIEKWLNGEKIQYILGVESEKLDKSQWHNFTEGAMQYIKRSDIKFREAPKYVKINGIEFKSVDSLLKHVKNNFDLEDGE